MNQHAKNFGLGLLAAVLAVNAFQSSIAINFETAFEEEFDRGRQFFWFGGFLIRLLEGFILGVIWFSCRRFIGRWRSSWLGALALWLMACLSWAVIELMPASLTWERFFELNFDFATSSGMDVFNRLLFTAIIPSFIFTLIFGYWAFPQDRSYVLLKLKNNWRACFLIGAGLFGWTTTTVRIPTTVELTLTDWASYELAPALGVFDSLPTSRIRSEASGLTTSVFRDDILIQSLPANQNSPGATTVTLGSGRPIWEALAASNAQLHWTDTPPRTPIAPSKQNAISVTYEPSSPAIPARKILAASGNAIEEQQSSCVTTIKNMHGFGDLLGPIALISPVVDSASMNNARLMTPSLRFDTARWNVSRNGPPHIMFQAEVAPQTDTATPNRPYISAPEESSKARLIFNGLYFQFVQSEACEAERSKKLGLPLPKAGYVRSWFTTLATQLSATVSISKGISIEQSFGLLHTGTYLAKPVFSSFSSDAIKGILTINGEERTIEMGQELRLSNILKVRQTGNTLTMLARASDMSVGGHPISKLLISYFGWEYWSALAAIILAYFEINTRIFGEKSGNNKRDATFNRVRKAVIRRKK